ncbi:MAG: hypothetical protein V3U65_13810 [Granulosicoccaceae bacterium]
MSSNQALYSSGSALDHHALSDLYFLEHRAKLLDIAAFLDRIDRTGVESNDEDFRISALRHACSLLTDGQSQRTRRILELLSHSSDHIPQSANGLKGASGAVRQSDQDNSTVSGSVQTDREN